MTNLQMMLDSGEGTGKADCLSSSDWSPQPLGLQQNCFPDPAGRGCAGLDYTTHRVRQTEGRLNAVLRVGPFSLFLANRTSDISRKPVGLGGLSLP